VYGDGDVRLGDQDKALTVGLGDERRGDFVEPGKEPGAQEETGDVAGATGDADAVGDQVVTLG